MSQKKKWRLSCLSKKKKRKWRLSPDVRINPRPIRKRFGIFSSEISSRSNLNSRPLSLSLWLFSQKQLVPAPKEEEEDVQKLAKAMTKNEQSKKRNRPRKLGQKKNQKPIHQNGKAVSDHDAGSAKRRKLQEPSKASSFLDKMRARLSGGHFRMINEKLYTCSGKDALNYFQEDTSLFDMYHAGYKMQMSQWPEQPVNVIINWLKKQSPSLVVADFGCGDAHIANSVKNAVFSLDLVSNDPKVIACDMANAPLVSSSVDVAVFCLSLMGTNYPSYLEEAYRVLKPCGWLLIAEVKSRFDPNTGGAGPENFSKAVSELGFHSVKQDFSNKMFILFHFKKKDKQNCKRKEIEWPVLKPCLYKRR